MVVINPVKNMFWGVAVDAGKRYSQVVDQTFHLSMAALEPGSGAGNEYVQVMLQRESSEFLLCSLQQGKIMQQPLDLLFSAGEELSFSLVGKGTVHLTGYVVEDEPGMEDEYSDEDDSDAPELVEMDPELLKPGSKRKALESALGNKKKKLSESFDDDEDDDDDDFEDDSSDDDDDEEFSEDELTFDEDDGSDIGDDDEEDDDDDDDQEEEEVSSPKAKKQALTPKGDNAGSSKKNKQAPNTPSSEKKNNSQKQNVKSPQTPNSSQKNNQKQEAKTPQTPNTPTNGESAKKKKKKNKNKEGNTSMNQSTNSTPEKSSSESTPKSAKKGGEVNTPKISTPGKKKVVAGGTVVEDVKVGHGPEAKAGKMVSVYYVGTLTSNNKRFDSCTGGKPFRFRLKKGEVIKGWDNGVEGMKVGGKRKIVVPANQGYGGQRQGPIPPNSSLTFEVELKAIS